MKKAEGKKAQINKRSRRTSDEPAIRVAELLDEVGEKLRANEFKPTVADFIKLLQLYKEFDTREPRRLEVTWIDPPSEIQTDAA